MATFVTISRSTRGKGAERSARSLRRGWLGLALAAIAFTAGTLQREPTIVRRASLAASAVVYRALERPGQRETANTGPWLSPEQRAPLAELEESISQDDPAETVAVSFTGMIEDDEIDWHFAHEPWNSPDFQRLREVTGPVRSGARDVFELSDRLRALTRHAPRGADEKDDPLSFFEMAVRGEPLTCRYFAVAFVGLCLAEGYTARLIGLSATGQSWDHAVTEVYLPQIGKWVLIDPDFNIAYRRKGQWLSAREVQEGWRRFKDATSIRRLDRDSLIWAKWRHRASSLADIECVPLGSAGEDLRQSNLIPGASGLNLEYFEYVFFAARNDYMTNDYPRGHPTAVRQYLMTASEETPLATPICPEAILVANARALYGPIGRSRIDGATTGSRGESTSRLVLSTMTPNSDHFETRLEGDAGWTACEGARLDWLPHHKRGILEVRSVNAAGIRGEPAQMTIDPGDTKNVPAPAPETAKALPMMETSIGEGP